MRGVRKFGVSLLLVGSGAVSAVALAAAVAWLWVSAGVPACSGPVAAALAGLAVICDRCGWRPPAVNRQVPQAWGHRSRLLAVAVRYGFRLGVGPATILPTWLWWAGTVVAASHGVLASVVAASAFVVSRNVASAAVSIGVGDGVVMSGRMRAVGSAEPYVRRTGAVLAVLVGLWCAASG